MKNIHILPTDKPSKIGQSVFNKSLHFNSIFNYELEKERVIPQHIYITSDEEIKLNDYVIQVNFEKTNTQVIRCKTESQVKIANDKNGSFTKNKIILTTDQELIKNGVQAIPDEFLEWFIHNPSCEEVEVKRGYLGMGGFVETNEPLSKDKIEYKIIIPKEEPKQEYEYIGECRGNNGNDVFKELAEWLLINKRSVFMDADISKESKKKIMNDLGYSSNSLDG